MVRTGQAQGERFTDELAPQQASAVAQDSGCGVDTGLCNSEADLLEYVKKHIGDDGSRGCDQYEIAPVDPPIIAGVAR